MFLNHAVILAAGKGERMKPVTDYCPKALVEVEGRSLIDYVLASFHDSHFFPKVHVTVGHLSHLVTQALDGQVESIINTKGRSNTWFLFNSLLKYIDDYIIYCPCDLIFTMDWEALDEEVILEFHDEAAGLISVPYKEGCEADFITKDHLGICKKIDRTTNTGLCASGLQLLNPAKINRLLGSNNQYHSFYEIWEALIEKEELVVFNTQPSSWEAFDRIDQL